jgi:ribosomal protein S18 acetylase RimI-like enzyme
LRVETQQVNVAACRLYQRHGFSLEYVSPGAYASLPDEIQLVWIKSLLGVSPKSRPDYILMSSTPRGSAR